MLTLGQISPPHLPDHPRRSERLRIAYEFGEPVRPPVVVVWPDVARALSGSHRIGVLLELYGEAAPAWRYALLVDGAELDALPLDPTTRRDLQDFHAGTLGRRAFRVLIEKLRPHVSPIVREALRDQMGKGKGKGVP